MPHTGYFWNYDKEAVDAVNAAGLNLASNKNIMLNNGYLCAFLTHGSQTPIRSNQMGAGPIFKGQHVTVDKFLVDKDGNIPIVGTVDGVDISAFQSKVVEIGDWNMDTTAVVNVAHGLTFANIRGVSILVRKDVGNYGYPIDYGAPDPYGNYTVLTDYIQMTRIEGAFFDSADFDETPFNRGWIVIWYVP